MGMNDSRGVLGPEDYAEPRCLLCDETWGAAPEARSVPQQRIIEKMNEYMSRRDYAGAERHLLYWLEEAELGRDQRGQLLIQNELAGHYRKVGDRDKAMAAADAALSLVEALDFAGTVSAGTTYVNAATVCNAFGENRRALELFEKARSAYESSQRAAPELLGGLYNNMGLTYVALGQFGEAFSLYDRAMEVMGRVSGGALEQAITCLNRADAVAAQQGMEAGEAQIYALLDQAYDLLKHSGAPEDGYFAFVYEKCAPTFDYYGYFAAAQELREEARRIYERP